MNEKQNIYKLSQLFLVVLLLLNGSLTLENSYQLIDIESYKHKEKAILSGKPSVRGHENVDVVKFGKLQTDITEKRSRENDA